MQGLEKSILTLLWLFNFNRRKSAEQQLGSSSLNRSHDNMVREAAVSHGNSPAAEWALKEVRADHQVAGLLIKGCSPLQTPCSGQGHHNRHQGKTRRRPQLVALWPSGLGSAQKSRQFSSCWQCVSHAGLHLLRYTCCTSFRSPLICRVNGSCRPYTSPYTFQYQVEV